MSGLKDIFCNFEYAASCAISFVGIVLLTVEKILQYSTETTLADEEALVALTEWEIRDLQIMENLLQTVSPVFSFITLTMVVYGVLRVFMKKLHLLH